MNRSARITGTALVVVGALLVAGVGFNFALANRAGAHSSCIDRAAAPQTADLVDAGEGNAVRPSYSLIPAGIRCAYALSGQNGTVNTFVDLGTFQGALGIGLAAIGSVVIVDGSRRARSPSAVGA